MTFQWRNNVLKFFLSFLTKDLASLLKNYNEGISFFLAYTSSRPRVSSGTRPPVLGSDYSTRPRGGKRLRSFHLPSFHLKIRTYLITQYSGAFTYIGNSASCLGGSVYKCMHKIMWVEVHAQMYEKLIGHIISER